MTLPLPLTGDVATLTTAHGIPAPEPASWTMLGLGLFGLAMRKHRV